MAMFFKKDFDRAREMARRAGELDPTYFFPVMMEGWIAIQEGKFAEAVPFLRKAKDMGGPPFVSAYLAFALGASGDRAGALAQRAALMQVPQGASGLPFNLALLHMGLGERDKAIAYLEQALAADSQQFGWLGHDALYDSLRGEPRFVALLKRLKFIQ
jgi:serine/threonine-protein kinase